MLLNPIYIPCLILKTKPNGFVISRQLIPEVIYIGHKQSFMCRRPVTGDTALGRPVLKHIVAMFGSLSINI